MKPPINGKIDYSNTVTITPIPKNKIKPQHSSFPMASESTGGVEIRMVVPIKESHEIKPAEKQQNVIPSNQDTIRLSLEDIIIAGLSKKPLETNYQCTKAFAEQYDQPRTANNEKIPTNKRSSMDECSQASPGDSDYESAQEQGLPFKIRKQGILSNPIKKQAKDQQNKKPPSVEAKSAADKIDLKIQKSIKDFFQTT